MVPPIENPTKKQHTHPKVNPNPLDTTRILPHKPPICS